MWRVGMFGLALTFLVGAETGLLADTLKHKETGEIIEGRFLQGRINNRRIFKTAGGETKFLDMDDWVGVEAHRSDARQEPGAPAAPPEKQSASQGKPKPGGLMTQAEVLGDLFERYKRLRTQHEAYLTQREAAKARVSDVTKSLAETTAEYRQDKQAVERVLKAAKTVRAAAARVLAMPPPRRPFLQPLPPRPNPAFYGSAFAYDLALDDWARDCARIRQNNELLIREYEASLRRYQALRSEAAGNLRAANAKVAECEQALADLLKARQNAQTPLKTERHDLTEGTRDADAEARKLVRNLEATTEAIRGIPEKIRLEHGVLEWQNTFYSLAQIEQMYADLLKQIKVDAAAAQIGPGANAAEHPARHPKQDEGNALENLIERVRAAQAP